MTQLLKSALYKFKTALVWVMASMSTAAWADSALTPMESRWLSAAAPVVIFAREQLLPVDIIIAPQGLQGHSPVAMAFLNGRCKLVLSLRAQATAQDTLERIPENLFNAVAQAITAHEVAHCWRVSHGDTQQTQASFFDRQSTQIDLSSFAKNMQSIDMSRNEEGFADLFGLAWTQMKNPAQYAQVHDWFTQQRSHRHVAGGEHDTSTWIKLASNPGIFNAQATPFEQVLAPWNQGLLSEQVGTD
jgi:hypothetical protein